MDIKNFETAYLNAGGKSSELEKEDGEYVSSKSQMGWQMWQAAAAVPEGFVLVPMKPTEKTINAMKRSRRQFSTYAAEIMYEAIIEAQEQSHE